MPPTEATATILPDDGPYAVASADMQRQFAATVTRHRIHLQRFVGKHVRHRDDAADLTQQALLEAVRALPRFRGDSEMSTWIFGIAMNLIRNFRNRSPQRLYQFHDIDALADHASAEPDPSHLAEQRQLLARTELLIRKLPCDMRHALIMVSFDEQPYDIVASRLGIAPGTIRSRVARARASLRDKLRPQVSLCPS